MQAGADNATSGTRSTLRRVVQGFISLAVIAAIFIGVLPRLASYQDVWATIRAMTWLEIATLVAVGIWNLATYWFVLVEVLPGLTLPQAAVANQASTAIANTLPGGGALGVGVTYAMYSSWGFGSEAFALSALVSGVWNNFVKLGMPVVALVLLAVFGDVNAALVTASLAGMAVLVGAVVLFGLMLRSERLAQRIGEALGRIVSRFRALLRKPPVRTWGAAARRFRTDTRDLLKDRWFGLTVATLISHISLYLVLLVALRHVGVSEAEVSWVRVLAAFAFVRLISALPVTPGGLGVVELGYAAALSIGVDAATRAQIVAAVLVFRFITYALPIPLGASAYLFWRRKRSWRRDAVVARDAVPVAEPAD
ncbi:MAG: YbhN family protein [Acidimicrobiia bacterium]